MIAIWIGFSAVLDPETNLVKGVILVVVVTVVTNAASKLYALRGKVVSTVATRMDKLLKMKIIAYIEAHPEAADRIGGDIDPQDTRDLPLGDIFAILDKSGDTTLDFEEFVSLFEVLEMHIPLQQQQRMFKFADIDNSGSIGLEEFEVAWAYLKDNVTDSMISRLGLDDPSILRNVGLLLVFFAINIPLFLLMIGLWETSNSFVSVVHSLFIGLTGILANRKKAKADAGGGVVTGMDEEIDNAMSNFGEVVSAV